MELALPSPLERLAERSPIAVRQVRQQLRSQAWSTALIAVPALCLLGPLLLFVIEDRASGWVVQAIGREGHIVWLSNDSAAER